MKYSFTKCEKKAVEFLADRYLNSSRRSIQTQELPDYGMLEDKGATSLLWKFAGLGLTKQTTAVHWQILPEILEAREQINAPKDYWNDVTVWFRSRLWSLPLLALFVGLPVVVAWIKWIVAIFAWFGVNIPVPTILRP